MIKKMELYKNTVLEELFTFIPSIKKFKIIQNNKWLNNKLNILYLKKIIF